MTAKIYEFEWCGIRISLRHIHNYCGVIEHLEIRSIDPENAPLPITETGYKSHFLDATSLHEYGGALAYVRAWLTVEADKAEWQSQKEVASQYSLF